MEKTRVFVCFHTNDLGSMKTLLDWDKNQEFDFVFEESLPRAPFHSEAGNKVKAELKDKIMSASHFLCLVGKDSGNNDWINWGVQTASVTGRKVIAVRTVPNAKCPASILNFGATHAKAFTFDAVRNALDAGEATSAVLPPRPEGEAKFENL
jgi:hypothetical protein